MPTARLLTLTLTLALALTLTLTLTLILTLSLTPTLILTLSLTLTLTLTKVAAGAGRRVWLIRSDDGGAAWSAPREITSQVKRPGWTWYATGPGGGLVLRNGR